MLNLCIEYIQFCFMRQFLSMSAALFASPLVVSAENYDNGAEGCDLTIITLILAALLALSVFILLRFWRTTNDISSLKAKICNKGLADRSIMRSEVMKLHLLDKDDEAFEILNDVLYTEARRLYKSTNDQKDYKGQVFMQGEDGSRMLSCDEFFDEKWKRLREKYTPLYSAIGHEIPDGLRTIGYTSIKEFGK